MEVWRASMNGKSLYGLLEQTEKSVTCDEMTKYAIQVLLMITGQNFEGNFEMVLLCEDPDQDEAEIK